MIHDYFWFQISVDMSVEILKYYLIKTFLVKSLFRKVCLDCFVRPSVTKFSQDWIISFFSDVVHHHS